jgi:ketosteroid isomerase-like protein
MKYGLLTASNPESCFLQFKTSVMKRIKIYHKVTLCLLVLTFFGQLNGQSKKLNIDSLKSEILIVEKNFERDLNAKGVAFAFTYYAAENAVIKRENDTLITGRDAIKNYYSGPSYTSAHAYWTPDFIDVSPDGTFAYTYGKYRWIVNNEPGETKEYHGIFHTVWKRQPSGDWKYVWD